MTDTNKIRKIATALLAIVSCTLLWFVIRTVIGNVLNATGWNALSIVVFLIGVIIVFTTLLISWGLLYSVRKDETPFNLKNVKRLKAVAVLLAVLEPYMLLSQWVFNKYYPLILEGDTMVSVHSSLGGGVFVAGLVVYCIALVFEYGIALQKQVDETL